MTREWEMLCSIRRRSGPYQVRGGRYPRPPTTGGCTNTGPGAFGTCAQPCRREPTEALWPVREAPERGALGGWRERRDARIER